MKERRDGQIDRREVICRVMVFQPDVQSSQGQWLNYWKAVLKGFGDTLLQWLDRTEMAGTVGMEGS